MTNSAVELKLQELSAKQDTLIKLLIFDIGALTLALPILQVQKIVRHNPVYGSGLSHVSLTHLADQEVTIVDLHQKLFKASLSSSSASGYFVISKNIMGEPLGIMVSDSPSLIDVTTTQVRLIPESYRQADTLEIASHVAIIPQTETKTSQTIFILDLNRLV